MATMTVMFEVAAKNSGEIMQALAPCMTVLENFTMEAKQEVKPKRKNGRVSKLEPLLIRRLEQGPATEAELARLLEANDFSATSISPIKSKWRKEERITIENDTWRIRHGR